MLPESLPAAWRARKRWQRADRLFVVWSIVTFVFFSLPKSKRTDYILTMMLSLGALKARLFDQAFERADGRAAGVVRRCAGTLAVAALATAALITSNRGD